MADDGDDPMGSEDNLGDKAQKKTAASKQNEKLYSEEGMLNTKLRKAEKKRRKKVKSSADAMDDDDYDFKVDYAKKGSAMDVGDDSEEDDGQIVAKVPMSGVNFDALEE